MAKNSFVLSHIDQILDCLTRGLDLNILSRGYGEEGRGVVVSYQVRNSYLVQFCQITHLARTLCGYRQFPCKLGWPSSRDRKNLGLLTG